MSNIENADTMPVGEASSGEIPNDGSNGDAMTAGATSTTDAENQTSMSVSVPPESTASVPQENASPVPQESAAANSTFTTTDTPPAPRFNQQPSFNQQPTQQFQMPTENMQQHNTIPIPPINAASSESFSSVNRFFKLMIPLLTGRAAQALKQGAEISGIWITGIIFTAFSIGLIVSNSTFSFAYTLYSRLTFNLIPQVFQYEFNKWFLTFVTFTIAGALFIFLRAVGIKISAMMAGVNIDFKKSLNVVTLAYSWVSAAALSSCFLVLLSFKFLAVSMLIIIPTIFMAEILTYIGMIKLGNYKISPVLPFAFTMAFTYPISFFFAALITTGSLQ